MDIWDWVVTAIVLAVGYGLGIATMLLVWPRCDCDHGDDT